MSQSSYSRSCDIIVLIHNLSLSLSLLSRFVVSLGTGGGAFASSMSNMSFLFPKSQQGYCLGINGGFGNLGVSMSQLLVPIFMNMSFGKEPLSEEAGTGWPNHGTFKCQETMQFASSLNPARGMLL